MFRNEVIEQVRGLLETEAATVNDELAQAQVALGTAQSNLLDANNKLVVAVTDLVTCGSEREAERVKYAAEKANDLAKIEDLEQRILSLTAPGMAGEAKWTVRRNIERFTNWVQAGDKGDDGGGTATTAAKYLMTPGTLVNPAKFYIEPVKPYGNSYWYTKLGAQPMATRFRLALQFMLPTWTDLNNMNAIEFEMEQCNGTSTWNMAWQARRSTGRWHTFFNTAPAGYADKWDVTDIPLYLVPGSWTSIVAEFARTADEMIHVGISINGQWYPLNRRYPVETHPTKMPYLNAGYQMDSKKTFPPYTSLVQNYHPSWM